MLFVSPSGRRTLRPFRWWRVVLVEPLVDVKVEGIATLPHRHRAREHQVNIIKNQRGVYEIQGLGLPLYGVLQRVWALGFHVTACSRSW